MRNKFYPMKHRVNDAIITITPPGWKRFPPYLKWQFLVGVVAVFLILTKDISLQFNIDTASKPFLQWSFNTREQQLVEKAMEQMNVSITANTLDAMAKPIAVHIEPNIPVAHAAVDTPMNKAELSATLKRRKQIDYIKRYARVARVEMKRYGVPASIKLAQGLLESNIGESKLATENNNHFGIKCFSKTCKRGHCSNFEDDSHKDFFRKYHSAWESYREHSQFLQKDRYRHLQEIPVTDYKAWAHGLKKAGYATDPNYAHKLIRIIEDLQLYRLDQF